MRLRRLPARSAADCGRRDSVVLKALLDGYHQEGGAPDPAFRAELAPLSLPELIERLRREAPPDLYARTDLTQPRRVIRALELARNSQIVKAKPLVTEPLILAPFYPRAEIGLGLLAAG